MTDTPTSSEDGVDVLNDDVDAVDAVHGLRQTLRKATGAYVSTPPECDTATIHLKDAAGVAHLLRRNLPYEPAVPPDSADPVRTLHAVLTEVGIPAQVAADGRACSVDDRAALRLTRLVVRAMQDTVRLVDSLAGFLAARGLPAMQPVLTGGAVNLGSVSIDDAARLAVALGAPPETAEVEDEERGDLEEWTHGLAVNMQLCEAFRNTAGPLIDNRYKPYCPDCDTDSRITLGRITVAQARRLLDALTAP